MKNYYSILGVPEDASQDDIKKAFRALAKDAHPDVNDDPKATQRFQEISEAYAVLGDAASRREYDSKRESGKTWEQVKPSWGGRPPGYDDDLFANLFKHRKPRNPWGFGGGMSEEDMAEIFSRKFRESQTGKIKVPLSLAAQGGTVNVEGIAPIPIRVLIPRGTKNGSTITVSHGGGDVKIEIEVVPDNGFVFRGDNVETTVSISLVQAILGCYVSVKSPAGESFDVRIPEGIAPGTVMSLAGQGLADSNLLVKVNVEVPKGLSDDAKEALKVFAGKAGIRC
jgi:DnaJ-class molecular chaperone